MFQALAVHCSLRKRAIMLLSVCLIPCVAFSWQHDQSHMLYDYPTSFPGSFISRPGPWDERAWERGCMTTLFLFCFKHYESKCSWFYVIVLLNWPRSCFSFGKRVVGAEARDWCWTWLHRSGETRRHTCGTCILCGPSQFWKASTSGALSAWIFQVGGIAQQ